MGPTILTGRPFPLLTPLLDSDHTIESIIESTGGQLSFTDVLMSLHIMEGEGLLWDFDNAASGESKPADGSSTIRLLKTFGSISNAIGSQLMLRNVRIDSSAPISIV